MGAVTAGEGIIRGARKACQRPDRSSASGQADRRARAGRERAVEAQQAQQMMDGDPAVGARVMRAELFPFGIAGGSLGLSAQA